MENFAQFRSLTNFAFSPLLHLPAMAHSQQQQQQRQVCVKNDDTYPVVVCLRISYFTNGGFVAATSPNNY
jgi:hypothetical protein